MAKSITTVACLNIAGHEKIVRGYIELRALNEAFAKAQKVTGSIWKTGSTDYWQEMRNKVEQHKRSELRQKYTKEVRRDLAAALNKGRTHGITPYIDLINSYQQKAFANRRELDGMIADEMAYAKRDEQLWGLLGRLAVIVKLRCDQTMVVLGVIVTGVPGILVGIGYSVGQDTVAIARDPKEADVWSIHGTGFSIISPLLEKVMEMDSGAVKILNWPQMVLGTVESLVSAKSDWDLFT